MAPLTNSSGVSLCRSHPLSGSVALPWSSSAHWEDVARDNSARRREAARQPASEVRDGWIFIAAFVVVMGLVAFRPRVTLHTDGSLVIQNPLRRWVVEASRVRDLYFRKWGLVFELDDGRKPWSIIFQDTAGGREPRWFDVAEAVTGERPSPNEEYDEDQL